MRRSILAVILLTPLSLGARQRDGLMDDLVRAESAKALSRMHAEHAAQARPTEINVTYDKLDVRISGAQGQISGRVLTVADVVPSSLSTVTFDMSAGLNLDSASVDGTPVPGFTRPGATAVLTLPRTYASGERIAVTIYYHGIPSATGFGSFGAAALSDGTTRWIWTLSEPYGARDWWPCIDHPSDKADSVDVWATCDAGYTATSNGILTGTTVNGDGSVTYRWKHRYPIASYLVAITICRFNVFTDYFRYSPSDSLPIVNYVTPDIASKNPGYRAAAALTPQIMGIYTSLLGAYPFIKEKYGHVEFGWGGGMEHQTLTSLGSSAFAEGVIAHELAHQWFGDMITCRTWSDIWLNEGFAQYLETVYEGAAHGPAVYAALIKSRMNDATAAIGPLHLADTSSVSDMFTQNRIYNKGASVHHMLRHVLGDSVYFAGLRAYANDPRLRYATASTADFRADMESASGRSLAWFFNEWVYGMNFPRYAYAWSATPHGGTTQVLLRIQQNTFTSNPSFFTMPIDVRFLGTGLDTTLVILNDTLDQTFTFELRSAPDSVALDPDNWILKSVQRVTDNGSFVVPTSVVLQQNYPNPFNATTMIRYILLVPGLTTLKVYDLLGRELRSLVNMMELAGEHRVPFDARGLASGAYLYRLQSGGATRTKAMVLVR
jgi:aminopeptidase N